MESAPIPDLKNVSTDSGVTFLHPFDYSYQQYIGPPPSLPSNKVNDFKNNLTTKTKLTNYIKEISFLKKKKRKNGLGASIRLCRETQCLPYAGFFYFFFILSFI